MAVEFVDNININGNEVQNAKFHILATDPVAPVEGLYWWNTTDKRIKYYDGTSVRTIAILDDLTGGLTYKGTIDASSNPNYPSGVVGDLYVFSVAGKIGGASGENVEAGDMIICNTDNAGGTEATVGGDWDSINKNIPAGTATKFTQTTVSIGNTPGAQVITHNLNSRSVIVGVFEESSGNVLYPSVSHGTVNSVTIDAKGTTRVVTVTVLG